MIGNASVYKLDDSNYFYVFKDYEYDIIFSQKNGLENKKFEAILNTMRF